MYRPESLSGRIWSIVQADDIGVARSTSTPSMRAAIPPFPSESRRTSPAETPGAMSWTEPSGKVTGTVDKRSPPAPMGPRSAYQANPTGAAQVVESSE